MFLNLGQKQNILRKNVRLLTLVVFILVAGCHQKCQSFKPNSLDNWHEPSNCIRNDVCCKKWLLFELKTNPSRTVDILRWLEYFPEVSTEEIERLVKLCNIDFYNKNREYLAKYRDSQQKSRVVGIRKLIIPNKFPMELTSFEKSIVHEIFNHQILRDWYSPVIKKQNLYYVYLYTKWYKLETIHRLNFYFFVDLDNIVFNKDRNKILITSYTSSSKVNTLLKKNKNKWQFITQMGIAIK